MAKISLKKLYTTQGETLSFTTTFKANGTAIDITGATVIVKFIDGGNLLKTVTSTSHYDPTNGVSITTVSDSDTATWPNKLIQYEIERTLASGDKRKGSGWIQVDKDI